MKLLSIHSSGTLAILAAALLAAGCSTPRQAASAGDAESQEVLARLRQSYATTPNLSVNGDLKVSGATVWFDALVRGRDSLKITLIGPFGVPVGALSATPDAFLFLDAQQGDAYEGRPDRESFGKLLMMELEYEEMISMLRGELPRFPEPGTYTAVKTDDIITYEVRTPRTLERFTIDIEDATLQNYSRARLTGDATQEELAITYSDYQPLGRRPFPRRGLVDIGGGQQKVTIKVERVRDQIDPDRSCTLDIPPGIDRRRL